jgi:hypothetical protein
VTGEDDQDLGQEDDDDGDDPGLWFLGERREIGEPEKPAFNGMIFILGDFSSSPLGDRRT